MWVAELLQNVSTAFEGEGSPRFSLSLSIWARARDLLLQVIGIELDDSHCLTLFGGVEFISNSSV